VQHGRTLTTATTIKLPHDLKPRIALLAASTDAPAAQRRVCSIVGR
jgi:predicted transcriptional regulator